MNAQASAQEPVFPKFEEYKLFVETVQATANRRRADATAHLTMSSAIIAALGLVASGQRFTGSLLVPLSAPLFALGIIICVLWYKSEVRYGKLLRWRIERLVAMEEVMPGCHKFYARQTKDLFSTNEKMTHGRLSRLLPVALGNLYLLYAVGLVAYSLGGLGPA